MRKIKIDVKLSFFANSIPTSNKSSGSDREFLFHISYLEERKKEKRTKIQQSSRFSLCIFG